MLKTLSFELGRLLKCATHICTLHREYLKDKKFADGKMKFISKRLKTHNVQKQVETVASSQILTLHFVVLSFDRYSRDDVVGEVMVELEGMDLSSSETCPLSLAREITPRSDKLRSQGRGELLVSLCHQVTFFQRQH